MKGGLASWELRLHHGKSGCCMGKWGFWLEESEMKRRLKRVLRGGFEANEGWKEKEGLGKRMIGTVVLHGNCHEESICRFFFFFLKDGSNQLHTRFIFFVHSWGFTIRYSMEVTMHDFPKSSNHNNTIWDGHTRCNTHGKRVL